MPGEVCSKNPNTQAAEAIAIVEDQAQATLPALHAEHTAPPLASTYSAPISMSGLAPTDSAEALAQRAAIFGSASSAQRSPPPINIVEAAKRLGVDPILVAIKGVGTFVPKDQRQYGGFPRITRFQKDGLDITIDYQLQPIQVSGKKIGDRAVAIAAHATYGGNNISAKIVELKDGTYLIGLTGQWKGMLFHLSGKNGEILQERSLKELKEGILVRLNHSDPKRRTSPSISLRAMEEITNQLAENFPKAAEPLQSIPPAVEPPSSTPPETPTRALVSEAPPVGTSQVISDEKIIPREKSDPIKIKLKRVDGEIEGEIQLVSARIVDRTKPQIEWEVEEVYRLAVGSDGGNPPKFAHTFLLTMKRNAIYPYGPTGELRINQHRRAQAIAYQNSAIGSHSFSISFKKDDQHGSTHTGNFLIQMSAEGESATMTLHSSHFTQLATTGRIKAASPLIILEGSLPLSPGAISTESDQERAVREDREFKEELKKVDALTDEEGNAATEKAKAKAIKNLAKGNPNQFLNAQLVILRERFAARSPFYHEMAVALAKKYAEIPFSPRITDFKLSVFIREFYTADSRRTAEVAQLIESGREKKALEKLDKVVLKKFRELSDRR